MTKDKLYEHLASYENLKIAYEYLKKEIHRSSLPLDPFWVPGIASIDRLGDAFFKSLSKLLLEGKYTPGTSEIFFQHKDNFGVRKIAMINVVDRLVYQAIFNKKILGESIVNQYSDLNYHQRLSESDDYFLDHYKEYYLNFIAAQKQATIALLDQRGEFDATAFFDNIDHRILFNLLEERAIGSEKVNSLLKLLLNSWSEDGKGIPQGPDASSLLANLYLTPLDEYFESIIDSRVKYFRYMDDIVILTDSEKKLYQQLEPLTYKLFDLKLDLNTKSEIEKVNVDWYEMLEFMDPYSEPPDGGKIVLDEIEKKIPSIIDKYKNNPKDITKRDRGNLKYFLKADKKSKYAEELMEIFPYFPSLADLICKYIQPVAYKNSIRMLILKALSEHHLFRWQRFWLAKVTFLEKIQRDHVFEVRFRSDSEYWEISSTARFIELLSGREKLQAKNLLNYIKHSETEFDLNLYLSLIGLLPDGEKIDIHSVELKGNKSIETSTILYAQIIDEEQIKKHEIAGDLFDEEVEDFDSGETVSLALIDKKKAVEILGFDPDFNPNKEMALELLNNNNELTVTGKLTDGKIVKPSKTQGSRIIKLIKCLCKKHSGTEKSIFKDYKLSVIVSEYPELKEKDYQKLNISIEKHNRFSTILEATIDYFLEVIHTSEGTVLRFRRGIDDKSILNLTEADTEVIYQAVRKTLENSSSSSS